MLSIDRNGHLPIAQYSVCFLIMPLYPFHNLLIDLLPPAWCSITPFVIRRMRNVNEIAQFCDRIFLSLIQIFYRPVFIFLPNFAQRPSPFNSLSFFNIAISISRSLIFACRILFSINAILLHNYSENSIRKAKTDKKDAVRIAQYTLDRWLDLREYIPDDEIRRSLKLLNRQYTTLCRVKTILNEVLNA